MATTIAYGAGPEHVADLRLPDGEGPFPVIVLIHGGFWRERYTRDLMDALAEDAVARGYATYNIEYRRVGRSGGGYPETFEDVAAAVDHLVEVDAPLDLDRVAVTGHSAGGHLALWVAARGELPSGVPGADPEVTPCIAIGQAAVSDLATAYDRGVGGDAVAGILGADPGTVPERLAVTSPVELLPFGIPTVLVHGERDDTVPLWQSEGFVAAATAAGDDSRLVRTDGDHYAQIAPDSDDWARVLAAIRAVC